MFSSARRWLRQNRTPIAVGVGLVGAGYVVSQYILSRINEARERMSSDRIAKENLRRRFEQNQEDCTFTVLALLPTATASIMETMNTERITLEIQQMKSTTRALKGLESTNGPPSIADTNLTEDDGKSSQGEIGMTASQNAGPSPFAAAQESGQQDAAKASKSKRQLWDDLTISAITRSFTLIYTLALLTMLTRIQLNLLGRRSYLSSVVALATGAQQATISLQNNDDDDSEQAYGSDFDTNRKYLTFSWWLLNKGWIEVMHRVEDAVRTVFGTLSPRDLISFERFSDMTLEVRKLVEGGTVEERRRSKWLRFLLPPAELETEVLQQSGILEDNSSQGGVSQPASASLGRLLQETADLIESPSFSYVLTLLVDAGFSLLVDRELAVEAFQIPITSDFMTPQIKDLQHTNVVQLPKVLSVLTRQAPIIGNGVPNVYLQELEKVKDLEAFSAVVYSSNWENEIHDDGLMDSAIHIKHKDVMASQELSQGQEQSQVEESMVLVDAPRDLEGAWDRATESQS